MPDEEKKAMEYLKARLYGNEGCKFIDVAQSDLRIFLNLIENLQKDIENWKKYCDEQENDITLKNNKICDLEFKIENQSKELEELKEDRKSYAEEYIHNNPWLYKQLNENYILKTVAEQKEKEANNEGYFQGRRDERDETDDKIKAKIEEVEQWELYNMKIPKLSTLDERLGAKIGIKYVLQSLLEKE